jgi:hypothetical protein
MAQGVEARLGITSSFFQPLYLSWRLYQPKVAQQLSRVDQLETGEPYLQQSAQGVGEHRGLTLDS